MYQLNLFGAFLLADSNGVEIPLKSHKAKALLAYLALPPGRPRNREEVMALLWSDRGEAQARASLRQILTGLRKELGENGEQILSIDRETVALEPSRITVAQANGEEFLAGFRLSDPAFEEWLRDERLAFESKSLANQESDAVLDETQDKPAVAVLPFQNLSDDKEQEYFADGMTVDIASQLSRFRTISVISNWLTSHNKTDFPRPEDVQQKFGANYVATGTVRAAAGRIRVSAQLLDAVSFQTVWGENYDRELVDVFAVQDEITANIVTTIAGQLEEHHRQILSVETEKSLTNHQTLLLAEQNLRQGDKAGILKARTMFDKVASAEPKNARAHSGLARTYLDEIWSDWATDDKNIGTLAVTAAQKAVQLDLLDARARINLGVAYQLVQTDFEKALFQFGKARELNPNDSEVFCQSGWCYALSGDADAATECTDVSIRLNPYDHQDCYFAKAIVAYLQDDFEGSLKFLRNVLSAGLEGDALIFSAACYARLNRIDKAGAAVSEYFDVTTETFNEFPGDDVVAWRKHWTRKYPFRDSSNLEHFFVALRMAGFPV